MAKKRKFPVEKKVLLFSRCETCEKRFQMTHIAQRRCHACLVAATPARCDFSYCRHPPVVKDDDDFRVCEKHTFEIELVRQRKEGYRELEADLESEGLATWQYHCWLENVDQQSYAELVAQCAEKAQLHRGLRQWQESS